MIDTIIKSDSILGYVDYLEKKYYSIPFPPSCWSHTVEYQPLPLYKVLDSFRLLAACAVLSGLLFAAELFRGKLRKDKNTESNGSTMSSVSPHTETKDAVFAWEVHEKFYVAHKQTRTPRIYRLKRLLRRRRNIKQYYSNPQAEF